MLICGSTALKYSIPGWREPKDLDYICFQDEYDNFIETNQENIVTTIPSRWGHTVHLIGCRPIEFEIARDGNTAEQFLSIKGIGNYTIEHLTPQEVYTFKMSHRYLKNSPHFKKTMDDILELRRLGFGTIPDYLFGWYKDRMKATYDYKHPKLKQTKDTFFANDGVNYIYDHDSIHEAVKTFDRPAFLLIKENEADVFCSKAKFYELPINIQLATVIEETYVLALERSQIPFEFAIDREKSFRVALMKVCTSITSGWWREFAWEHYYDVLGLYKASYVDLFHDAKEKGLLRPYRA